MLRQVLIGGLLTVGSLTAEQLTIERKIPRFKLDTVGWTMLLSGGTVTGLDYYSTHKIISMGGYEKNQIIANGRGVNYIKVSLIDLGNIGSILLYQGVAKNHIPKKYRWIDKYLITPAQAMGVGYKTHSVVNNFRLINSH